jgi:Na+/melibiose symporter-like transporter
MTINVDTVNSEASQSMPMQTTTEEPPGHDIFDMKPTEEPTKKESFYQAATSQALRPFVIISTSYLLFTITDGAMRMIVLLHAYTSKFSAMQVAIMFTLYELAGVFTNLAAGLLGAKWGIKYTLIAGLVLQLFSYGLLFGWRDDWSQVKAYVAFGAV